MPYAVLDVAPSPEDRITDVTVNHELGNEGFTYQLASGLEGTVHIDHVLDYNQDPNYLANLVLYKLTVEAQHRLEKIQLVCVNWHGASTHRHHNSTGYLTRPIAKNLFGTC